MNTVICLTEAFFQPAQPRRAAQVPEGALKPPDPVGIPCARTNPADMRFSTSPLLHSGHSGNVRSPENISFSNRLWHFLHSNSYMGIGFNISFQNFSQTINRQRLSVKCHLNGLPVENLCIRKRRLPILRGNLLRRWKGSGFWVQEKHIPSSSPKKQNHFILFAGDSDRSRICETEIFTECSGFHKEKKWKKRIFSWICPLPGII